MAWIDELYEIAAHLHSYSRAYEPKAVTTATRFADAFGAVPATANFWSVTSANPAGWGAWVQILGTADTPFSNIDANVPVAVQFDLSEILIINSDFTGLCGVQLGFGASGAAALLAGTYSTEPIFVLNGATAERVVFHVKNTNIAVGTPVWIRILTPGQTAKQLDIIFNLHEYPTVTTSTEDFTTTMKTSITTAVPTAASIAAATRDVARAAAAASSFGDGVNTTLTRIGQ